MEKGRFTSRVFANRFRSRNGRFSNMRFAWTRGTLVGYADVPARALHMWIPHYPVNADQYSTICENSMTQKNWLQSKTTRGNFVYLMKVYNKVPFRCFLVNPFAPGNLPKTRFEASRAVFWSPCCCRELKLTIKPFADLEIVHFADVWSRCKTLAYEKFFKICI